MRDLNVFEIRTKPQFFAWHTEWLGCDYHIEKTEESLSIYAEYNIICEAQYLYLFELVKKPGGFVLKFFSKKDVDAFFISNDKEEVIKIVMDKILEETALGKEWARQQLELVEGNAAKKKETEEEIKNYMIQEEKLKKILREKLEEFIG